MGLFITNTLASERGTHGIYPIVLAVGMLRVL